MPEISVIVPVYNVEKYLDKCITSILQQTFTDFELILIDDGSKDKSGEICDEYCKKDSRIKVIHKENGGVSAARNTGIDNATGAYITFVDSDDYIDAQTLDYFLNEKFDNIDLVMSSIKMLDKQGVEFDYKMPNSCYTPKELLSLFMQSKFPQICLCGPVAKRYSRKIIKEHNIVFRNDMSLGEDTYFNLQYLICCESVESIKNTTYYYIRDNQESLFSSFQKETYKFSKTVFEFAVKCAEKLDVPKEIIEIYLNRYLSSLIGNLIKAIRSGNKKIYLYYAKQSSNDEYLLDNIKNIKIKTKLGVMGRLLISKKFNLIYYVYKIIGKLK